MAHPTQTCFTTWLSRSLAAVAATTTVATTLALSLASLAAPAHAQSDLHGIASLGPINNAPCIDAWNGPVPGQTVSAGTCWKGAPQDFRVFTAGADEVLIAIGPLCLAPRQHRQNGSETMLLVCNDKDPSQRWQFSGTFDQGPGLFAGTLRTGGKCLDLKGNPAAVGANERRDLVMWDCNGQDNQRWMYPSRPGQTWQRVN